MHAWLHSINMSHSFVGVMKSIGLSVYEIIFMTHWLGFGGWICYGNGVQIQR